MQKPDDRVEDDLRKLVERLDNDLRRLLERLSNSTKRQLVQELSSTDGELTTAGSAANSLRVNDRKASELRLAATSDVAPPEEKENVSCTKALTDREALVALRKATDGANWIGKKNWNTDAELSTWHGVKIVDGRVVSLSLYFNDVRGPIPPELGNLGALQKLDLSRNQLSGPIPPELGNLGALQKLYLYSNKLSGPIPPELGNLGALQKLYLYSNQLSGPIPPELGNLGALEELDLQGNQLSGRIPKELEALTKLQHLWLNDSNLTGKLRVGLCEYSNNVCCPPGTLDCFTSCDGADAPDAELNGPGLARWKEQLKGAAREEPWAITLVEFLVALWHFIVPILDDITDLILLMATFEDRGGLWWACSVVFVLVDVERIVLLLVTALLVLCWIPFALIGNNYARGDRFSPLLQALNGGYRLQLERILTREGWDTPWYALRWPILDGFLWAVVGSRSKSSALMKLWGLAGNTQVKALENSGLGLSLIDRIVDHHPYSFLGRALFFWPHGHHLPGSRTATRRSAVMLRAVGETLVVDPLFLALSLSSDIWEDGVSIGVYSLIFSVLELLTELQYYASEARVDMVVDEKVAEEVDEEADEEEASDETQDRPRVDVGSQSASPV